MSTALSREEAMIKAHTLLIEAAADNEDIEGLASAVLVAKTTDTTLLRVIAGFLKDNEVTAPPIVDDGEETLAERLARMKNKRTVADTPHTMN